MNYEKSTFYFKSSNGVNNVACYLYVPAQTAPKAVVQISHGMCEYLARYEDFISFLCGRGFIVCGNDHIGHGASVNTPDELGFFAENNGWRCLVKDVVTLSRCIQERYPDLPYFLLGHSMGSLIARTVIAKYSEIYDGALILGTLSLDFGADACLAMVEATAKLKGSHYRSKMLDKMMFGMSNIKIEEPQTEYDWICTDMDVVTRYAEDPNCTFIFTARAMYDLIMLVKYVSKRDWAEKISTNLPVYIAGGAEDPVGRYGKCLKEIFERLLKADMTDVELKIYEGMRHEILNEVNKAEVYDDILGWLEDHIPEK